MSEQTTKSFGQIAYEAAFHPYCPSCEWFNLSAMEQERWQHVADEVKFAVCTNIDQKSFLENAPHWNFSTLQRYPVLSAEQAKSQKAMRPMTPEERAAVGEFVIQQLSTPQRNK